MVLHSGPCHTPISTIFRPRRNQRPLVAPRIAPAVRLVEIAPVAALLALCVLLCVLANPAMSYLQDAAAALHAPGGYIEEVLRK